MRQKNCEINNGREESSEEICGTTIGKQNTTKRKHPHKIRAANSFNMCLAKVIDNF